jgi:hypothetical protein
MGEKGGQPITPCWFRRHHGRNESTGGAPGKNLTGWAEAPFFMDDACLCVSTIAVSPKIYLKLVRKNLYLVGAKK